MTDATEKTLIETIEETMADHRTEDALQKAGLDWASRPYQVAYRYDSMTDRYYFTATMGDQTHDTYMASDVVSDGGLAALMDVLDGHFGYQAAMS